MNHKLNYRVRGDNLILKLDMAKAYDRVQWASLYKVMQPFGFSMAFIGIIKRCIEDCLFSVKINGCLSDDIMILMNGSLNCIKKVKSFLVGYMKNSGQVINRAKYSLGFLSRQNVLWPVGSSSPVNVPIKRNTSPWWKRLMKIRMVAEQQIGWRLGQGRIIFWHDSWLDKGPLFIDNDIVGSPNILIFDFMDDRMDEKEAVCVSSS
ncbi:hypothetical protein ZIOFF_038094 [Zingiber officinale]|uniref:Reverse transcriptase n=1 Tax=Zingiber officinale TaxID=94328 RepID=A0A8J5GLL5_ZINOF|nr:hypothetical protein ZIOFF_038094 [Zingiber officinale]